MALTFEPISQISSSKPAGNIKARVVRLWKLSDFNRNTLPFSIEMVLMDSEGSRIHASIKKTLWYKFQSEIREGKVYSFENMGVAANGGSYKTTHHPYKLNFQFGTKCLPLFGALVSGSDFKFVPISDIVGGSYDCDYLVDVIGMLTGVGTEREYERNGSATKLNVIAMEADGYKLQCTLFGTYVDKLNTFLATGETANVVVSIQLAKVKVFQGE
ncbi:uncharacterized protein [Medicago truncatula]|uniref:uncharacterized protein n=1 Tax=Medicago truncatula TaxID=3880 RepID=UPI0019677453|nr:uncharacterized protein LOC120579568 [Medicago truncatula]